MTWSKLNICNLAFNKLNKKSVASLANSGEFSDSAEAAFDMLYPSAISGKSWRFATKIATLNVLVAPPPIDWWTYQLQLPSDYLAVVRTYPRMDFQIYENNVMYANNNIVQLEYRFLPDVTRLPAYFVNWFVIELAAWFANAVCEDDNLAKSLRQEALTMLGEALFNDSQSHPIPAMMNNPLIQCRSGLWYQWDRSPMTGP
jgi:hypothetical protein